MSPVRLTHILISVGLGLLICQGCEVRSESQTEAQIEAQRQARVETDRVEPVKNGGLPCQTYPETGSEGPFRLSSSESIVPPRRITFERPEIASLGLKMSEVGMLLAEAVISETGSVDSVRVIRSADPEFDRVSVESLSRSRYEPATRDGKPVAVCIVVTIRPHL